MVYFISPWQLCNNQLVLLNPFTFFHPSSKPPSNVATIKMFSVFMSLFLFCVFILSCRFSCWYIFIAILKKMLFIYLFRERGKEGEKHQCVVASRAPPTGDLACHPGMCPGWESNQRPFGSQAGTQFTEPHQPGPIFVFQISNFTIPLSYPILPSSSLFFSFFVSNFSFPPS